MPNVLVTGTNGQLGSELRALVESNALSWVDPRVKPEDDESRHSREGGNPAINYDLSMYHFHFVTKNELDITKKEEVEEFIVKNDIKIIINCAAYTAVDRAEDDQTNADTINHLAVRYLAEISNELDIRLIHISTDYVFDGKNYRPYTETDITNPINEYGRTKLEGENAMIAANPPNSIIIRTSWVYSSYGTNFVKTMLVLGKEKESLNVIYDQVGTPTYAKDLAKTILEIIQHSTLNIQHSVEVYHYSNEGVLSWYDFAKEIMRMAKLECKINPIETKEYPTLAARPHYSLLNKAKIKNKFNLEIPYWKDSLSDCITKIMSDEG